ncbi:MAG TPA: AmmeMemoRadiSam system protein B [Sedimentisphaerales bacterium]|nr:AmmeMemoRadiSam system protein B [Sedimentisphaerales bacterium]
MHRQSISASRSGSLLLFSILSLCVFALLFTDACKRQTPAQTNTASASPAEGPGEPVRSVLRSLLAGTWYSADPEALRQQLDGFFQKADAKPIEDVVALILPHAGYAWSGQTAAFGLKTTQKQYKRVVVIGPSHRTDMEEIVSVPRATHYETPFGQIPLDTEFIDKLLKYPMVQTVPSAHQAENSIEMEVPIVQYRQGEFKLVPIVAGRCSLETIERIGVVLRSLVDKDTLVIASSDFVHYGPNYSYVPFNKDVPEQIRKLDMGAYERIAKLDARSFLEYTEKTGATICGRIPIAILLSMLGKTVEAHLAHYASSGELTGDFTNSVSYLSVAFAGAWQDQPQIEGGPNAAGLAEQDKKQLLALARKTMVYALQNRRVPEPVDLGVTIGDAMQRPRAAFVTLTRDSMLRGCIGDIFPQRPLYKSVIINAIHACLNDRRFAPVSQEELKDIHIEISVLTVPAPIASPDEIRIGIDGVVLNKDGQSAVFLPQVAPEQGWNLEQMLTQLSRKAQLPADGWKEGASFQVFQAVVFGENER